jgi:uncharacterized protein
MNVSQIFRLAVGTTTGSIIAAGVATGLTAANMFDLYVEMGGTIFPRTLRSAIFPLTRYRYAEAPLKAALEKTFGTLTMGDLWKKDPRIDLVIPSFDLQANRSLFIKPWKPDYASFPLAKAVQASSTVPTYFPVVDGRYIDGGVGSYANPCYLAAYEAQFCLEWDPAETTLISLGTGREPNSYDSKQAASLFAWDWIDPILGAFLESADDQQVTLVQTFFNKLDFRRFQVDLSENIDMDDTTKIPQLIAYGIKLGRKILSDNTDPIQKMLPTRISDVQKGIA